MSILHPLLRVLQTDEDDPFGNDDPCGDNFTGEEEDDVAYTVIINILVFFTVWGISSVVDFSEFKKSFKNPPIYAGAAFQFFLMPLIGFITVIIFPLNALEAIGLLILCASPGGSFSNWWCNLFNADLALSVSMTALSTVSAVGFLPLNILLYVTLAYDRVRGSDEDDVEVEFADLAITLGTVIAAILLGIFTGATFPQFQTITNIIGNVSGMLSIAVGLFATTGGGCENSLGQAFYPLWIATAFPLLVALVGVLGLGSILGLPKPQRVAIALETAYQNTGISLAYLVGQGVQGRAAAAVPIIYGGYEAGFFGLFMLWAWKAGWTYAPSDEKIWKVMFQNYQPHGDNHKALFPNYYPLKPEAEEFNKSFRKSLTAIGRRLSSSKVADEDTIVEAEDAKDDTSSEPKEVVEGEFQSKDTDVVTL